MSERGGHPSQEADGKGRSPNDPAALKPQVYVDPRPASDFDRCHAWARTHCPDFVQDLVRVLLMPVCLLLYRARPRDSSNVSASGPVILAPNHFSAMDHFFCGIFLRRRVSFMAKSQLFKWPLASILRHGGAFPVRRGLRDEEAIITALGILRRGGVVVIYPEGGRSRTRRIGEHARPGVGRLALESGAPVVPVAIYGSLQVREWRRLRFPRVTVRYGAALSWEAAPESARDRHQEVADAVLAAVRDLYRDLSEEEMGASDPAPAKR